MSKRFTDTKKWEDPWYMDLPVKYKLAYLCINDKCSNIGVWNPNKRLLDFFVGEPLDWEKFIKKLNGRIKILPTGEWWIIDFIDFQYGSLDENSASRPVQSYIRDLKKHSLWILYLKGIDTLKEKEKEQKQEKEQEKDKEKGKFEKKSLAYRLAEYLVKQIRENSPNFRTPDLQRWSKDIDLMLRLDNRPPDEIGRVIAWAQCDDFWRSNILSAKKLREKYDQLLLRMGITTKSSDQGDSL